MTNLALLDQAGGHGLTIRATGENLLVQPATRCPSQFAEALRQQKSELLALLRHEFLIIQSVVLDETVYFAANEDAKAALVSAGAEPGRIYTRDELRELVAHNQRSPITAVDLLRIHAAKRTFDGRITSSPYTRR